MPISKTSLISHWAGGSLTDSHGSNTLSQVNGATASTTGKVGDCWDFEDGNERGLEVADSASVSTGDIDFTICCWVQLESKTTTRVFVCKDTAVSGEFYLWYVSVTDRFRFDVYGATAFGSRGRVTDSVLGAPSTATWYFLVAWHDATANTVNLQINNGAVQSVAHTAGVIDGTGSFKLGHDSFAGEFHDGLLDEVSFFKRVLTSDERTALYNHGNGQAYPWNTLAETITATNATWPRPANIGSTYDVIECYGGGGGGGVNALAEGGGGGGAYAKEVNVSAADSTLNAVIGAGGGANTAGGDTSVSGSGIGTVVLAKGGGAGSTTTGGTGGQASGSTGSTKYNGGNGGNGVTNGGGGGGSSGGTAANGNTGSNGVSNTGGAGGTAPVGGFAGGNGGNNNQTGGSPGANTGAGAGGGGTLQNSGTGGSGRIVITWTEVSGFGRLVSQARNRLVL